MTTEELKPLESWVLYNTREECYYSLDEANIEIKEDGNYIRGINLTPADLNVLIGKGGCYDTGDGTPMEGLAGLGVHGVLHTWPHNEADELEEYFVDDELEAEYAFCGGNLTYWREYGFNPDEFILFPIWIYYENRLEPDPHDTTGTEKYVGYITRYKIDFTTTRIKLGDSLRRLLRELEAEVNNGR